MTGTHGAALIGAGWVSGEYVKAFRDHPEVELKGIFTRTPAKAEALLREHGVEARIYATEDELFDDDEVSIVASTTSPDVRARHIIRAAESGRHVVIEKPVGLDMGSVREIRDAVGKAGVKSVTSFVLRWNPQLRTTHQMIADGLVGDVLYAEADYWHPLQKWYPSYYWMCKKELGGSALLAAGCHAVDTLRWFCGDIKEVAAFSSEAKFNPDYTFPPNIVGSVRFGSGQVGKVSTIMDAETPYIFNTRVFGSESTVLNNRIHSSKHFPGAKGYWSYDTILPDSGDVTHHPFYDMIDHFVDCIENDKEALTNIEDAAKSMAVCFALDESAARGGEVVQVDAS